MPTFNFSSYYLNSNLSDLDIVVTVPDDVDSGGRKTAEQLPGHGIVLANVSASFKAQIEHQGGKRAKVKLDVRVDQVPAARAVVQYVYTGILPEYDHHPQQEPLLVHMLHLAHGYGVRDCAAACLHSLMETPQLQPETVHLVYSLLSEATDLPEFARLMEHCSNHLHQQFGNLEATMSDPEQLDNLHKLPHAALLALLEDGRTEAAAENTVLAAVQSWLAHQPERVELQQRQQLAGAVRIPQLEPMYLATVLPRIPWLVEVLGARGISMAAAAAKGMYDVHTMPVLSNTDVCGPLTAAWMKGMRKQPGSCMLGPNEPGFHIDWSLPLAQVKQAFDAACAAAAASVERLQAEAAHAALRDQQTAASAGAREAQLPGWGSSGTAAVSAAAATAVSLGVSMFRKRKRSTAVDNQPASASIPPSPLAAVAEHDDADSAEGTCRARKQQMNALGSGVHSSIRAPLALDNGAAAAAAAIAGAEAAAAAANPTASDAITQQAAGTEMAIDLDPRQKTIEHPSRGYHGIKAYSQEVNFAGYSWRLVFYFEARAKQEAAAAVHSSVAAAAVNAAVIAGGCGRQLCPAAAARASATTVSAHSPCQQTVPLFMFGKNLRANANMPGQAGPTPWVQQDLGSLQTPWGSRRGLKLPRSPRPDLSSGQAVAQRSMPEEHARHAVAAAAAMRLPDDLSPAAEAGLDGAGALDEQQQDNAEAHDSYSWKWHGRLAIEAWPCIALQPGVSLAAFSASLAVKESTCSCAAVGDAAGIRAVQVSASIAAAGVVDGSETKASNEGRQATTKRKLASNSTAAAAPHASARAHRSSSNHAAEAAEPGAAAGGLTALQALGQRSSTGLRRRAAAVAAQQKILQQQQAGKELPVGDEQAEVEAEVVIDDSSDGNTGDERPDAIDDECHSGAWGSSNGGPADCNSDDDADLEGQATAEKENQGTTHFAPASRRGKVAASTELGSGSGGQQVANSNGSCRWLVRRMPQGRYVKSRKCDQGYSDFFQLTLQQGQWDAAAWRRYMQPGGMLQIKATIWNVR